MIIEVEQENENKLSRHVVYFVVFDNSNKLKIALDRYAYQTRKTKRHYYNTTRLYERHRLPRNSMTLDDVKATKYWNRILIKARAKIMEMIMEAEIE